MIANAAYLQVCLIAYNLVQTFKSVALPKGWGKFEIKNLRFRLLCRAAKLIRHAGYVVSKVQDFTFFDVFAKARWAVLDPEPAASG